MGFLDDSKAIHARRHENSTVAIPKWLAPVLITLAITGTGLLVKAVAGDEARGLDKEHVKEVTPKFQRIENEQIVSKLERSQNASDIKNLYNFAEIAQSNHDIILKIATKLDVPTDTE